MATRFKQTILAVDDIPEILVSLKAALRWDYHVYGITTAEEALEFLQNRTPDLFILDIDMPDMDGYDLAETIRQMKNHKNTPIIFLTNIATPENVIMARQAGGNDYIIKPIDHEILLSRVKKFLS